MSKYPPAFESLWQIYPRRIGKRAAMLAWTRAVKRGATEEEIHNGLEARLSYLRSLDPQFCPHLSTWLNQERWLDEISGNSANGLYSDNELRIKAEFLLSDDGDPKYKRHLAQGIYAHLIDEMVRKGYLTAERAKELGES